MISYTGILLGRQKVVTATARCMIYNHRTDLIYLSTENKGLAIEIVRTQTERDPKGEYKAYELTGDDWHEIKVIITKSPKRPNTPPPLFLF